MCIRPDHCNVYRLPFFFFFFVGIEICKDMCICFCIRLIISKQELNANCTFLGVNSIILLIMFNAVEKMNSHIVNACLKWLTFMNAHFWLANVKHISAPSVQHWCSEKKSFCKFSCVWKTATANGVVQFLHACTYHNSLDYMSVYSMNQVQFHISSVDNILC